VPLGRSKPSLPCGRNRTANPPEPAPAPEPDLELESYLAALAPGDEAAATEAQARRFGGAQVLQLRLPEAASEQLRGLAEECGTSPLALVQEWVVQRLEWELRQRSRF
jgi:hypothetical protein